MAKLLSAARGRQALSLLATLSFILSFLFSGAEAAVIRSPSSATVPLPPYAGSKWNNWYLPEDSSLPWTNTSSSALVARTSHETAAEQQIHAFIRQLAASSSGSRILTPSIPLEQVEKSLQQRLSHRKDPRIRVVAVLMGGSQGDVNVISSVIEEMMRRSTVFDVQHVLVMPGAEEFFPRRLQMRFLHDRIRGSTQEAQDRAFAKAVDSAVRGTQPDLILTGHGDKWRATRKAFRPKDAALVSNAILPTNNRVVIDVTVLFDPKLSPKLWKPEDVSLNRVRLYAQEPSVWNNPDPGTLGAPMVGKLRTVSGGSNPNTANSVLNWISQQRSTRTGQRRPIIYLGMGGSAGLNMGDKPTPIFESYVNDELNQQGSSWSYIIFHNVEWNSKMSQTRETHGGRVYHLYRNDIFLADLFRRVNLVVSHGGVGTLTDALLAGIPQVVLPVPESSSDQAYFAEHVESDMGIGLGLPAITKSQLAGTASKPYDWRQIRTAVNRLMSNTNYVQVSRRVQAFGQDMARNNGLSNVMEVVERVVEGMIARKST
jgi:UDP-N-acetylglucosamine:LPS N-acetylglucosamine transferase